MGWRRAEGGLSQDEPPRHGDCFELKAIETLQALEEFCPSLNYVEESKRNFPESRVIIGDTFYRE